MAEENMEVQEETVYFWIIKLNYVSHLRLCFQHIHNFLMHLWKVCKDQNTSFVQYKTKPHCFYFLHPLYDFALFCFSISLWIL